MAKITLTIDDNKEKHKCGKRVLEQIHSDLSSMKLPHVSFCKDFIRCFTARLRKMQNIIGGVSPCSQDSIDIWIESKATDRGLMLTFKPDEKVARLCYIDENDNEWKYWCLVGEGHVVNTLLSAMASSI